MAKKRSKKGSRGRRRGAPGGAPSGSTGACVPKTTSPAGPAAGPRGATAQGASGDDERGELKAERERRYWLRRAQQGLAKGKPVEALARLDRAWPSTDSGHAAGRLRWICAHLPPELPAEIRRWPADVLARPSVAEALADCVLALPEATVNAFLAATMPLGAEWTAGARRVRRAATLIAAGDDEAGLTGLRRLGLRSPFRAARVFLKGLVALYAGRPEEARRGWGRLGESPGYGRLVATLLRSVGGAAGADVQGASSTHGADADAASPQTGEQTDEQTDEQAATRGAADPPLTPAQQAALETFGLGMLRDRVLLLELKRLLQLGRRNGALRVAAQELLGGAKGPPPQDRVGLAEALLPELVAELVRADIPADSAVERVARALALPRDGLQASVVMALAEEESGECSGCMAKAWEKTVAVAAGEPRDLDAGSRERAEALLLARVAHHRLRSALELQETNQRHTRRGFPGARSSGAVRKLCGSTAAEHLAVAEDNLEQALTLHPTSYPTWQSLLAVAQAYPGPKRSDRVLERMVVQLPKRPEVLVAAAQAARRRGSFDLALRHVRKAIALEPLNRSARDEEVELLLSRGRKKHAQGKPYQAAQSYRDALGVPHCRRSTRITAQTELAALLDLWEKPGQMETLRQEALAEHGQPWVWAASFMVARERLRPAARGRSRANERPAKGQPTFDPTAALSGPPSSAELVAVLRILEAHQRSVKPSGAALRLAQDDLPGPLRSLAQRAVRQGYGGLEQADEIKTALRWVARDEVLDVLRHARRRCPDCDDFCLDFARGALDTKADAEILAEAASGLRGVEQRNDLVVVQAARAQEAAGAPQRVPIEQDYEAWIYETYRNPSYEARYGPGFAAAMREDAQACDAFHAAQEARDLASQIAARLRPSVPTKRAKQSRSRRRQPKGSGGSQQKLPL